MAPALHQRYNRSEALQACGADPRLEGICDGQFVILPDVILMLTMAGESRTHSHFSSPSCFVWVPGRDYRLPSRMIGQTPLFHREAYTWLPYEYQEHPRTRDCKTLLFVRTADSEDFFFAGPAQLGSYGTNGEEKTAYLYLNEKLPRDDWVRFGGYPGWLVTVNHVSHRIDLGDEARLEELLANVPEQEFSHVQLTHYEEDALTLHTNSSRGWLMYERYPGHEGIYVEPPGADPDVVSDESFQCACGISLEFPRHQTLTRERSLSVVCHFFRTGKLTSRIRWSED